MHFGISIGRVVVVISLVSGAGGAISVPVAAAPLADITQIEAGQSHACARLASTRVRCWGFGKSGQMGNGTTDHAGSPVGVRGVNGAGRLSGVARIAAGSDHTCALLGNGQVRCWGLNASGQLGDGTNHERLFPVVVTNGSGTGPLKRVKAIAGGGQHTCALLKRGRVRCWGSNHDGQLGDGSTEERLRPVSVKSRAAAASSMGSSLSTAASPTPAPCSAQARRAAGEAVRTASSGTGRSRIGPCPWPCGP